MIEQFKLFDIPQEAIEPKKGERKPWTDYTPEPAAKVYNVLSYGAGKQTFTMLVLIEQGKLPKPDLIILADTQNEKPETYQHLEQVAIPLIEKLGIEFARVTRGNLYDYCLDNYITPMWPSCTTMFKVRVINGYVFKRFGLKPGVHQVDSWIGITTDESHRTTPSTVAYVRKTFPLLELGLSRDDCIALIEASGYPVPVKSGCVMCPHDNWERIYTQEPERFQQALPLELNAATRKPDVRLPEYGRGLRQIMLQPKFKWSDFEESCATGFCHV